MVVATMPISAGCAVNVAPLEANQVNNSANAGADAQASRCFEYCWVNTHVSAHEDGLSKPHYVVQAG